MSMPRAVRHINEVRILDVLYRQGSTTRAELARHLGLMRSTVGNLIAGLAEQGLVIDIEGAQGSVAGKTGRPGQLVQLNATRSAFLGVDIGVGHLTVVALDLCGRVTHRHAESFPVQFGEVTAVIDRAATAIEALLGQLGPDRQVEGLTVVVPGLVHAQGVVHRAPVLGWHEVPVQRLLVERLGWSRPIEAENDANAFAAAELYRPEGTGLDDGLFVYLDAGVGGGLASAGRLWRGHRGHAGEIGHIHLGEQGFERRTAVQGSFESYVGREAVLARHVQHGGPALGWSDFLGAVQDSTPAAQRTLADWAWWMGRGLASLVSVLDPGRVVLGGPVAALHAHTRQAVLDSVRQHLVAPAALPAIEPSAWGADACAVGGAMLLHRAHLSIDERLVYGSIAP